MQPIRIGIAGYGNLGRGVEAAIAQTEDLELVAVFTRRPPESVTVAGEETPVLAWDTIEEHREKLDVMILCGGSQTDLPEQSPAVAALVNTVDSFDTHARIPEHFEAVDHAARANGTTALISVGWDPGLFSLNRLLGEAILPEGSTYTFWGRGLSQGHSDALRRVPGVADAVQYTVPQPTAVNSVRAGHQPTLSTRDKHTRQCFVVLDHGADEAVVREHIVTMPDYFADYDTEVNFISLEELKRDHSAMPHGGFVIRSGTTADEHTQTIEYALTLDSNPEFTASVLVAYARAAHRMNALGQIGAKTVFDVPPGLLSPKTPDQLRAGLL